MVRFLGECDVEGTVVMVIVRVGQDAAESDGRDAADKEDKGVVKGL